MKYKDKKLGADLRKEKRDIPLLATNIRPSWLRRAISISKDSTPSSAPLDHVTRLDFPFAHCVVLLGSVIMKYAEDTIALYQ
jgi:hypothetical protein